MKQWSVILIACLLIAACSSGEESNELYASANDGMSGHQTDNAAYEANWVINKQVVANTEVTLADHYISIKDMPNQWSGDEERPDAMVRRGQHGRRIPGRSPAGYLCRTWLALLF